MDPVSTSTNPERAGEKPLLRGMGVPPMQHRRDADATEPHGPDACATFHAPSGARWPVSLAGKPDFDRCMDRIDAWFHQQVLDRPPIRFYKHNAQYEAGEPLDRARWSSLEQRWFDTEYQLDSFEQSLCGQTFPAETFPIFWPNLGPNVYSAFYAGQLRFAEVTSWTPGEIGGSYDV